MSLLSNSFRSGLKTTSGSTSTLIRSFHISASNAGRLRPNIKLRPPIVPKLDNIAVKDDHPLWQFFSDKKFMRSADELKESGKFILISNYIFFSAVF